MNLKYKFKFKRGWFWQSRIVIGHRFEPATNKMCFHFDDGGVEEIPNWNLYAAKLGQDWCLAMKAELERKTGQVVPINRDLGRQ